MSMHRKKQRKNTTETTETTETREFPRQTVAALRIVANTPIAENTLSNGLQLKAGRARPRPISTAAC